MLFAPHGKGRKKKKTGKKGQFWPISRKGGQTPLKPPFVTPPFAAAQNMPGASGPNKSPKSLDHSPKGFFLHFLGRFPEVFPRLWGVLRSEAPRDLSGPVSRPTARLSQRYPPIARYGVLSVSARPTWVRYPSP